MQRQHRPLHRHRHQDGVYRKNTRERFIIFCVTHGTKKKPNKSFFHPAGRDIISVHTLGTFRVCRPFTVAGTARAVLTTFCSIYGRRDTVYRGAPNSCYSARHSTPRSFSVLQHSPSPRVIFRVRCARVLF